MIVDFKMKFEVLSSRESSLEHFGKRGISWHGCALVYYLYEIIDDDGNYGPKEYRVYIDQILEGSNRQDGAAVVSLLEAVLTAITTELPFVEEIILQSDNAKSYQNHWEARTLIFHISTTTRHIGTIPKNYWLLLFHEVSTTVVHDLHTTADRGIM